MKLVQISDTHLTHRGDTTARNVEKIVAFLNDVLRPDLVVHTGDVVALEPEATEDKVAARRWLDGIEVPLRIVPGNCDVGDGEPGGHPWQGGPTRERLAAHREVFGDDRFLHVEADHAIIGLNSELLGTGLPEEDDQWDWLASAARSVGSRPVLVMHHRPLWFAPGDRPLPIASTRLDAARVRLFSLFAPGQIRAIGNGHRHRFRRWRRPELLEVWAPSTSFLTTEQSDSFPVEVFGQPGVVEWQIDGQRIDARYRAPADLEERAFLDIPTLAAMYDEVTARTTADTP